MDKSFIISIQDLLKGRNRPQLRKVVEDKEWKSKRRLIIRRDVALRRLFIY